MTYEEWKLELIRLIINETKIIDTVTFLRDEINCVLNDDCDYPKLFKDGESPEDVWQGEIDAIADSQ
jgi:hypothetical protein